jgi:ferrous iron transport protein B
MNKLTIALAGNPNSGKTTIFNNLTGSNQRVGNYPGVTVEKKEGTLNYNGMKVTVIDLPGTYSLTAYSPEEIVARHALLEDEIDVIVNIVDATNAERNLNLTAQLKEVGLPLVIAMNMVDMASKQGIDFDYSLLSTLLDAEVIPVVGTKNNGMKDLLASAVRTAEAIKDPSARIVRYENSIEEHISLIQRVLPSDFYKESARDKMLHRWFSIKLLENDNDVIEKINKLPASNIILDQATKSRQAIENLHKQDPEFMIIDGRLAYIRGACREAQRITQKDRETFTDMIDRILLNRVFGLPIFFVMMWLLFQLTFTLGAIPMDWLDIGFTKLGALIDMLLPDNLFQSLLIDGIIGGVGGVLIFLPNILLLFLGIGLLEGTGYMARTAFVTDKFMHMFGLHGKSFIPMLLGFGCTIPAIMATRTLENSRDRLVTLLVVPLMSCGARLPVYTLLISAFFDRNKAGNVLFSIYLIGVILAVVVAKVLRTWILPGESEPFVMELPVYRMPTLKSIFMQMWIRTKLYIEKAGTLILAASLIMWVLFTFPVNDSLGNPYNSSSAQLENSYAGKIGHLIEPALSPLGLDWKTGIALTSGIAAKEMVVSTLGALYSIEDTEALSNNNDNSINTFAERARTQSSLSPLTAYVLMLFILIYVPCLASIAVIRRETNSWKWPLFTIVYTLSLAWVICFIVYRAGLLFGLGT